MWVRPCSICVLYLALFISCYDLLFHTMHMPDCLYLVCPLLGTWADSCLAIVSGAAANRELRHRVGTLNSFPLNVFPIVRLLGHLGVVLYTFLRLCHALFYNGRGQDSNWWHLTEENNAPNPEITSVRIQDTLKPFLFYCHASQICHLLL